MKVGPVYGKNNGSYSETVWNIDLHFLLVYNSFHSHCFLFTIDSTHRCKQNNKHITVKFWQKPLWLVRYINLYINYVGLLSRGIEFTSFDYWVKSPGQTSWSRLLAEVWVRITTEATWFLSLSLDPISCGRYTVEQRLYVPHLGG